jgi:soluble lytic murein transglycosylase-like protein
MKVFLSCVFLLSTTLTMGAINNQEVKKYIQVTEKKYDLPINLLYAIIKQESDFNIYARLDNSHGLGQITEETGRSFCGLTTKRLYAYKDNINCAGSYLRYQLKRYDNDTYLAIAAYNTGTPLVCNGSVYVRKLNKKVGILDDDSNYRCTRKERGLVSNKKYVRNVIKWWKTKKS